MHSLVEHLKKRKENTIKDGGDLRTSFSLPDLNEIITALSPTMPDDVAVMCKTLRASGNIPLIIEKGMEAADMLERLQAQLTAASIGRDLLSFKNERINYQAEVIEQRNAECSRQFKRIAELEGKMWKIAASKTWLECIDISHATLKVVD